MWVFFFYETQAGLNNYLVIICNQKTYQTLYIMSTSEHSVLESVTPKEIILEPITPTEIITREEEGAIFVSDEILLEDDDDDDDDIYHTEPYQDHQNRELWIHINDNCVHLFINNISALTRGHELATMIRLLHNILIHRQMTNDDCYIYVNGQLLEHNMTDERIVAHVILQTSIADIPLSFKEFIIYECVYIVSMLK